MVYKSDKFTIPGLDMEPSKQFSDYLTREFKPENGDVVIIGTANDPLNAEIGAKAIALELLKY